MPGQARLGTASPGKERPGSKAYAVEAGRGIEWNGEDRPGLARYGLATKGKDLTSQAELRFARFLKDNLDFKNQDVYQHSCVRGLAVQGRARPGTDWQGKARLS
jgi:hypothetical protein